MRLLFLGDVVGRPGRQAVADGPLLATPGHPGAGEEPAAFTAPLHVAGGRRPKLRAVA
ncbi:hypothetical protein [Oceanibaculum pacificum]|uniref:hypothetical protein n=1 Tax=Oceanibaculum pacificum TaxID=580166 RepID=UPI000A43ED38|nr:hypothetical protein [Oceanibaculum pacificum]